MIFNYPVGKTCVGCFWYDERARNENLEGGICFVQPPQVIALPREVKDPSALNKKVTMWAPAHIEGGVRADRPACKDFADNAEVRGRANPS